MVVEICVNALVVEDSRMVVVGAVLVGFLSVDDGITVDDRSVEEDEELGRTPVDDNDDGSNDEDDEELEGVVVAIVSTPNVAMIRVKMCIDGRLS